MRGFVERAARKQAALAGNVLPEHTGKNIEIWGHGF